MIEFIHGSFFDFNSLSKIDQSFFFRFSSSPDKCKLLLYTSLVHRSYSDLNNISVPEKGRNERIQTSLPSTVDIDILLSIHCPWVVVSLELSWCTKLDALRYHFLNLDASTVTSSDSLQQQ